MHAKLQTNIAAGKRDHGCETSTGTETSDNIHNRQAGILRHPSGQSRRCAYSRESQSVPGRLPAAISSAQENTLNKS